MPMRRLPYGMSMKNKNKVGRGTRGRRTRVNETDSKMDMDMSGFLEPEVNLEEIDVNGRVIVN